VYLYKRACKAYDKEVGCGETMRGRVGEIVCHTKSRIDLTRTEVDEFDGYKMTYCRTVIVSERF